MLAKSNFKDNNLLRVAVPRKGRLKEPSFSILQKAGYSLPHDNKALSHIDKKAGIEFFFLRTEDIPILVEKEILHIGISGLDLIAEHGKHLQPLMNLPYGHCRLCVAGFPSSNTQYKKKLQNPSAAPLRIVTSFPTIAGNFFKKKKIKAECIVMQGSVEIMVGLHNADAIIDIVESGETLRKNGLVIYEEIGTYQCALFQRSNKNNSTAAKPIPTNKKPLDEKLLLGSHQLTATNKTSEKKTSEKTLKTLNNTLKTLLKRIRGIAMAKEYSILEYNLPKKLLKHAESITPGFDAPTISHLDNPNLVAVKVMIKKTAVHDSMDKLHAIGATGIYELSIKNSRL